MSEEVFGYTPQFDSAYFRFVQDGNTVGTTKEIEKIEIELYTQIPGDNPFFVIKSETGFSFDSIDEVIELLTKCTAVWEC